MNLKHYIEITSTSNNKHQAIVALFKQLHGVQRSNNLSCAIDLPRNAHGRYTFNKLRLFSENISELNVVTTLLKDKYTISEIVEVDYNNVTSFVSHTRFSIPTHSSDRHEFAPLRTQRLNKMKKMCESGEGVYFNGVSSRSNKSWFTYNVVTEYHNNFDGVNKPNSYGVGTSTKKVYLPVI